MNFMQQFDTVSNSEAGATLHFKLPDGDLAYLDFDAANPKKAVTVTMLGSSSDAHKRHAIAALREMRAESKKKRNKKKDDVDISESFFEETAAAQVRRLAAVVTGWTNIVDDKGGALECNKKNVEYVFGKYQELRVQAINFLDEDANFIKS